MAADAKFCPQCGTRNKTTWEYCVGCGESLVDVTVSAADANALARMATAATTTSATPSEAGAATASATYASPWTASFLFLVAIAGSVVAFHYVRPPTGPPALFSAQNPLPPPAVDVARGMPPAADVRLVEGRSLLYKGDAAGALEKLAAVAADHPTGYTEHYVYAQALWQLGNKDAAIAEYRAAAANAPEGTTLYRLEYARSLAAGARPKEAVAEYERLLRDQPDATGYTRELAVVYAQMGAAEKAIPLLTHLAQTARGDFARFEVAGTLEQIGATTEAEKVYRAIVTEKPASVAGRAQLADLLSRTDRPDDAVRVLDEGLLHTPEAPGLHRQLAGLLERTGHPADAAKHYREYLRLAPQAGDIQEIAARAARLESELGSSAAS